MKTEHDIRIGDVVRIKYRKPSRAGVVIAMFHGLIHIDMGDFKIWRGCDRLIKLTDSEAFLWKLTQDVKKV